MRCSITSRNSLHESASAPSADRTRRPHSAPSAENSSKNFGTVGITCHTTAVWIAVWTSCGQPSHYPALRSQHDRRPHSARQQQPAIHSSLTPRYACHAGPTMGYPQCPQALILLLLYLRRFFFEEASWGHIDSLRAKRLCDAQCHPDRLAFKLSAKDLRWFSDSRYGRRHASGRRVVWHRETAG